MFDVIVLGTGLKECILSGLLSSVAKLKVLHLDKNSYYGGECASLNLEQLYKQFRKGEEVPQNLGRSRDYCVDLAPKFLMACEELVRILLKTEVTSYLDFRSVAGSYVYQEKKVYKVPSTATEALSSSLLGMLEKVHFKSFLQFVGEYEPNDPKTHKGLDLEKMTAKDLYKNFSLGKQTADFTGHAIALHVDDAYLDQPAIDLVNRAKLYAYSVSRYGNSPYIYPKWGLGGLPEGFSRRSAVYGGVFMLNVEEKEPFVEKIVYDGKRAVGVQVNGQVFQGKQILADPTYFLGTDKVKRVGAIARSICILSHPVDNTNKADSCQIIIPASEVNRKSDIYVCVISYLHNVAPEGKYVAVISANLEGNDPVAELKPALALLGKIDDQFTWVSDVYDPANNPKEDGCFITSSLDATTHFVTSTKEVLAYYELLAGEKVDLTITTKPGEEEHE